MRNDTTVVHLTDTQLVEIPAGGLGVVGVTPVPSQTLILNQGGVSAVSNGTGVVQPLTQLFRVKAANDVARAEAEATRGKARGVEDETALRVHQIYYRILIADVRRRAVLAKIQASEDLQRERVQQVRYGSALEADLIESRAHALQARQELLTTELQRSDLQMQLNDVIGLPLTTPLLLDPNVSPIERARPSAASATPAFARRWTRIPRSPKRARRSRRPRRRSASLNTSSSRTWRRSRATASRTTCRSWPTASARSAFARASTCSRAAESAPSCASARRSSRRPRRTSRGFPMRVELRVQTAYNKMERTPPDGRGLGGAARAACASLGASSPNCSTNGGALGSQAKESAAQELEAQAALLQSQLDYVQAADEMDAAIGRRPH